MLALDPLAHQVSTNEPEGPDPHQRRELASPAGLDEDVRRLADLLGDPVERPQFRQQTVAHATPWKWIAAAQRKVSASFV